MRLHGAVLMAILMSPAVLAAQAVRPAADSAWSRGDRDSARSLYLVSLAQDRTDAVALFRLGLMAGWAGRQEESITWFDRLLALHPGDRDARTARARALAAGGDIHSAIAAIDSILVDYPDETEALVARARFALWQRDSRLAHHLLSRAIELDPENGSAFLGLATALRQQGRPVEAARAIERASELAPEDADVHAERDRIRAQTNPRIRSVLAIEDDSDGNGVVTVSGTAGFRPVETIAIRADAWTRSAGLSEVATRASAGGVMVGLSVEAPSGWSFGAAAGAAGSNTPGDAPLGAVSAVVTTPRERSAVLTVSAARSPLDYTLPLIRNRVTVTEAGAAVSLRTARDWDLEGSVSVATYDVRSNDLYNHRVAVKAALRRRLTDRLALALGANGFGFDRDIDGGFFDPDLYALVDASLEWRAELPEWTLEAAVAPGLQQAGRTGKASGAVRTSSGATWRLRPGREISLRAVFANTGFEQLNGQADGGYRYAAAVASFTWWF